MKTPEAFQQCYNAQAAVDAASQVIVAHGLTPSATDRGQLLPMVDRIREQTGAPPREVSADCGYCTEAGLVGLEKWGIHGYIATGKQKHGEPAATTPKHPLAGNAHGRCNAGCDERDDRAATDSANRQWSPSSGR